MIVKDKIYKTDKNGNTRVWWVEHNEVAYCTKSGVVGGAITESGLTYPSQKNLGKSNETSVTKQVEAEIDALYVYQLHQGRYHRNVNDIANGANFVECMLAETFKAKKHNKFPYIGQPKLDGARSLGISENNLQTRNGKQHLSCPHILNDIERFQNEFPDYILDGELYNHDLKDDFEILMSLIRKSKKITDEEYMETRKNVFFYVYDVITPTPMTLKERIQFLEDNVYGKYDMFRTVPWEYVNSEEEAAKLLDRHMELGYEGTMLRNPDSLYQSGRTKDLIKYKVFEDIECEVVDVNEGNGTWSGRAKSAVIKLPDGIIQESGIKGNFAFTEDLLENKEFLKGTDVTVQFQRKTADGKLKFPVIKYWWKGKRDV